VSPADSLQVPVWVEVTVSENDRVSACQVDSQASSAGGQQENLALTIFLVEGVNDSLSVHDTRCSIESFERPPTTFQVSLEQIEHHRELTENEHLMLHVQKSRNDPIQELHLIRLRNQLA
jgi:hypothetical protein